MKTKVIRSGDKNFEEEKNKMFEPKQLNKEEQLRIAFTKILENSTMVEDKFGDTHNIKTSFEQIVNELLTEVKIRTKL